MIDVANTPTAVQTGVEWLVDARGCRASGLADEETLRALCDDVISELGLRVLETVSHKFPGAGGLTAMYLLAESHLTCHSWPEHGVLTLNLHCCRERPEWPWHDELAARLGATEVTVRRLVRGFSLPAEAASSVTAGQGVRP